MKVRICSGFNDKELERDIQKVIFEEKRNDYHFANVKYSISYDDSAKKVLRSALLIFDENTGNDDEEDDLFDFE